VHHAVHDPVAAGLDAAAGGLVELHPGVAGAGGHGGHLRDRQAGALDLDQRLAELRHHALHLVEVAAGHLGRRRAPVERVLLVDRPVARHCYGGGGGHEEKRGFDTEEEPEEKV
ncbi:hypothetical protein DKP78_16585, partial [Enterococcus faecium]